METDRKLSLVGRPEICRSPRDEGREYLSRQHRAVREAVSKAIAARPRGRGPRPIAPLYRAQEGSGNPLGNAFRQVEGLAKLRDHALDELVSVYDESMWAFAWVLFDFVDDAIHMSNERRAEAAKRGESA